MQNYLILGLGLFVATPVSAEPLFNETVNAWTVEEVFDACIAYNKPGETVGEIPERALVLVRDGDHATDLAVVFWPDALAESDKALMVKVAGETHEYAAERSEDYDGLRFALTDDVVATLATLPKDASLTARAVPSGSELQFDVGDLPDVLETLDRCEAAL